jgi:hypothetical protein
MAFQFLCLDHLAKHMNQQNFEEEQELKETPKDKKRNKKTLRRKDKENLRRMIRENNFDQDE